MTASPQTNPAAATVTSYPIRVYNTLTRAKENFTTVKPGKVGIYLCGPTVYKESHIGHMVGPVIFDTLKRFLTYSGYEVTWVVNITDIDDKLIAESKEKGKTIGQIAEAMTKDYVENLERLGVDQIDLMPRATEHVENIVSFVEKLIERGYAYAADGDVFFDVAKDSGYGKLSNRSTEAQQGEGGGAAAKKRNAADFALWKAAKPGEPSWDSPWGQGRPGWHIECSVMSKEILGETFDIHGGGLDLVFPHHENELAQSECCHDKPMAKYWLHNGLMRASVAAGKVGGRSEREQAADGEGGSQGKISRSKGDGGLADLIAQHTGERIRFFLLRTHYRSTILFNGEALEEAGTGLETFYRFFKTYERVTGNRFYDLEYPTVRADVPPEETERDELLASMAERRTKFLAAMDDDFNTAGGVAELFEILKMLNRFVNTHDLENAKGAEGEKEIFVQAVRRMREMSSLLGLFLKPIEADTAGDDELANGLMQLIIEIRAAARGRKDFATADQIRDGLKALNITLEDRAGGTDWSRG